MGVSVWSSLLIHKLIVGIQFIDEANELNLNLKQLRFAVAVAEKGSFTEAAAACFVTQPTLSNGIAQLEEELGDRLFVRTTRKVALTPLGRDVLPYMEEVLRAQASLEAQIRNRLQPSRRLLRIGTSPLIRANLLSLIVEPFRGQQQDVDVVLREMNMTDLYRMLGEGLLDVVIGVAGTSRGPWHTVPLYREPLMFLPRGDSYQPRGRGGVVRFSEIGAETFVMVPDACGLAHTTRDLFRRHRRKLNEYSGEAMSYQVLEEWAALGIGAAILPQSRLTAKGRDAYPIVDKNGAPVTIGFEAAAKWQCNGTASVCILEALAKVAPRIVAGLGAL
ncbi:LysR family transcriptional regulator [Piscinibacter aquaticus]|uniref:LysR family transcriptional regulator n=1 Tax=Piscinibacter aquaticus TaxID=392597 RepID=A0A5C6U3Y1_9BURK|nr:LysR family transcriptional regulator [Piscinibacter aquaticus]